MRYSLFFCPTFYFFPTTCFVQNSRIHAKNFRNSRITQVFLEIHANPIFREIGEIFGKIGKLGKLSKIGEICTNLDEKGKFTRSRKKQGRFTHSRNRKMDFHVHASLFNSRIHAIFFRFSRIHATKKSHSRKPLGRGHHVIFYVYHPRKKRSFLFLRDESRNFEKCLGLGSWLWIEKKSIDQMELFTIKKEIKAKVYFYCHLDLA